MYACNSKICTNESNWLAGVHSVECGHSVMHQRHVHIGIGRRERELLVSMFLEHLVHVLPSVFTKRTERAVLLDKRNDLVHHYVHAQYDGRSGRQPRSCEALLQLAAVQLHHVPEARIAQRVEREEYSHVQPCVVACRDAGVLGGERPKLALRELLHRQCRRD